MEDKIKQLQCSVVAGSSSHGQSANLSNTSDEMTVSRKNSPLEGVESSDEQTSTTQPMNTPRVCLGYACFVKTEIFCR